MLLLQVSSQWSWSSTYARRTLRIRTAHPAVSSRYLAIATATRRADRQKHHRSVFIAKLYTTWRRNSSEYSRVYIQPKYNLYYLYWVVTFQSCFQLAFCLLLLSELFWIPRQTLRVSYLMYFYFKSAFLFDRYCFFSATNLFGTFCYPRFVTSRVPTPTNLYVRWSSMRQSSMNCAHTDPPISTMSRK